MIRSLLARLLTIVFMGILFAPLLSWANGKHSPGTVVINNYPWGLFFTGPFNVRYNPAANSSQFVEVSFITGANASIQIVGVDANGVAFACYVPSTDTRLYPAALAAMQAAGNGAVISAMTPNNTTATCRNVTVTQSSASLD